MFALRLAMLGLVWKHRSGRLTVDLVETATQTFGRTAGLHDSLTPARASASQAHAVITNFAGMLGELQPAIGIGYRVVPAV
ncbi:hypothetical protein BH24ACT15_BH24ACT15_27080 [soil metagenome]